MLERRAVAAPGCDGRCGFGGVTAATPGETLFRTGPLPGRADGSVAALGGWYRYRGLTTQAGRVEVLDPGSLRAGRPSPPVPCGSARALSTAKGRLLVECDDGRVVVFASA